METKVSVILPSLNVAYFIDECLSSVVKSTLKEIEIICVDAGSTDGTLDIIQKYIENDARIKLIRADKKSYGYQVNRGISLAVGEYIGIVDTDDFIAVDMYEKLYSAAKSNEYPDFVKADYEMFIEISKDKRIYKEVKIFNSKNTHLYSKVLSPKEYPEILLYDNFIWKGIYKREYLQKNKIKLNESPGAAFQDNGFLFQTICLAEKAIYLNVPVYKYRRDNEQSSVFNIKGFYYTYNEYSFIKAFLDTHSEAEYYFGSFYYRKYFEVLKCRFDMLVRKNLPLEVARNEIELIHEKFVEFHKNGKLDSNIFTDSLWVELNMFIKNPESYVKYMNFLKALKSDDLENMIKKLINKKNIVLFGRGNMGGIAYYVLIKEGINSIIAWCDNNEKYQGTEYMGKKVYSLEDVIKKYDKEDLIFVITSVDYKHEIRNQLIKNKINPENVFCYNGEGYFGI